jgi:rare lipoprotein A
VADRRHHGDASERGADAHRCRHRARERLRHPAAARGELGAAPHPTGVTPAARRPRAAAVLLLLAGLAACQPRPAVEPVAAPPAAPAPAPQAERPRFSETGLASWYGPKHQGAATASGERFDAKGLTGAHRTIALGTLTRVTALDTGKTVRVRINDRGPHRRGRIIDLSAEAASQLDLRDDGVGQVKVEMFSTDQ